jgi:hypothetical protein
MSLFWMQYEPARAHRPFVQRPEQQSLGALHVLFAVVQLALGEMASHLPLVPQLPVQHALPLTGQAAPMVKHWTPPHLPLMQDPLQQSVLPAHAAASGAHAVIDEAHVLVALSQRCEQQLAPLVHVPPAAVQLTGTLPSGTKLTTPLLPLVPEASPPPLLVPDPLDVAPLDVPLLDAVPPSSEPPPCDELVPQPASPPARMATAARLRSGISSRERSKLIICLLRPRLAADDYWTGCVHFPLVHGTLLQQVPAPEQSWP